MEETDKYQGGKQHKNIKSEFFPYYRLFQRAILRILKKYQRMICLL